MRALEFITGHVIYNPAYTYKLQLKTTIESGHQKKYLAKPKLKYLLTFISLRYPFNHYSVYIHLLLLCEMESFF